MAAPSPSSSSDPVTAPPLADANLPRSFLPSPMPPTVPVTAHLRPPVFTAQPLHGKPLNSPPPSSGIIFSTPQGFSKKKASAVRSHAVVDQIVTLAHPTSYIRGSNPSAVMAPFPTMSRPLVFSSNQVVKVQAVAHSTRQPPPQAAVQFLAMRTGGVSGIPKAAPVPFKPKVASFPTVSSTPDFNSCKDRECREDNVMTIRGRKVRLLDGGSDSLYTLCRSWLRNGLPQDSQPNVGAGFILPKPLPASLVDSDPAFRSEDDFEAEEPEKEEHFDCVEQLSTHDLLERLVKHSKRVRAGFRKERIRRIARFNHRLSLLLPAVDKGRGDDAP